MGATPLIGSPQQPNKDLVITCSSERGRGSHGATSIRVSDEKSGGWCRNSSQPIEESWVKFDFGQEVEIKEVQTKKGLASGFVTKYTLSFSADDKTWTPHPTSFTGYTTIDKTHVIQPPIKGRFVKFQPLEESEPENSEVQMEFLGVKCKGSPRQTQADAAHILPDDTVQWKWGEADFAVLGQSIAQNNPFRWSKGFQLGAAIRDLEKFSDKNRLVEMRTQRTKRIFAFDTVDHALSVLRQAAVAANAEERMAMGSAEQQLRDLEAELKADDEAASPAKAEEEPLAADAAAKQGPSPERLAELYASPTEEQNASATKIQAYARGSQTRTRLRSQASVAVADEDDEETLKIILLGNPGSGKSSFGNRLAEKKIFESGPACGTGMTDTSAVAAVPQCGKKICIDTPGVLDVYREKRKQAAEEITKRFRKGGRFQVLFFATELAGRISDTDRLVIKLVLDAVPEIEDKYAVIFNRCSGFTMQLSRDDPEWKKDFERFFLERLPRATRHICYIPNSVEMESVTNACWPLSPEVKKFLEDVPEVTVKKGTAKDIDAYSFEDLMEKMRHSEESKKQLQEKLDQARRVIQARQTETLRNNVENSESEGSRYLRERDESIDEFQRDAERIAKKNTKWLLILLSFMLVPAVATLLIGSLFDYTWVVTLGSKQVIVQKLLAPIFVAQMAYSIYSCKKALTQEATVDHQDNMNFEVRYFFDGGFHFRFYDGRVKYRHVWMLQRLLNTVSDFATLRTLCASNRVPALVSTLWCLTTIVPFFVIGSVLRAKMSMSTARLLIFGLEDDIQAVLGLTVLFQYTGSTIGISTIKSCASAFLSILQSIGDLKARLSRTPDVQMNRQSILLESTA